MGFHQLRLIGSRVTGEDHDDEGAALCGVLDRQARLISVKLLEARPRVRQADPPARQGWRESPGPSSRILISSISFTRVALISILPAAERLPMPWRTAFSTSGCRPMWGTAASRTTGSAAERDFLRLDVLQHAAQQIAQAGEHLLGHARKYAAKPRRRALSRKGIGQDAYRM
jgi:hypothetical protein